MIKVEINKLNGNLNIISIDVRLQEPPQNITEEKVNQYTKDVLESFGIIKSSKMATDLEYAGNYLISNTDIFCQFNKNTTTQEKTNLKKHIIESFEKAFL